MMPLLLLALGLLASAVFSAVETAIVSANRTRLSHRAQEGDRAAARTLRFLDDPRGSSAPRSWATTSRRCSSARWRRCGPRTASASRR
jgi:CBS domain containing-hemolysin-like protein